jgi:hypothetical protein
VTFQRITLEVIQSSGEAQPVGVMVGGGGASL